MKTTISILTLVFFTLACQEEDTTCYACTTTVTTYHNGVATTYHNEILYRNPSRETNTTGRCGLTPNQARQLEKNGTESNQQWYRGTLVKEQIITKCVKR